MTEVVSLEVRKPADTEFDSVRALRYEVLDQPLGLPKKAAELNDKLPTAIHMAAILDGRAISTVRLDQSDEYKEGSYLVRRMATDPEYRGRGIGRKVLSAAEVVAANRGANSIVLHARPDAAGFYERLGYEPNGKTEMHDGLEDLEMWKALDEPKV